MLPLLRALKDRLLNEPTFFLYACSVAAAVVAERVDLPVWVPAAAIALFGVANRAVVRPERQVRAARKKLLAARRAQSRGAR